MKLRGYAGGQVQSGLSREVVFIVSTSTFTWIISKLRNLSFQFILFPPGVLFTITTTIQILDYLINMLFPPSVLLTPNATIEILDYMFRTRTEKT